MKRIKAACLEQTVSFMQNEGGSALTVKEEYERYKTQLERSRTQYKILEENTLPDGSIVIKINKQYNGCSVGDYFN